LKRKSGAGIHHKTEIYTLRSFTQGDRHFNRDTGIETNERLIYSGCLVPGLIPNITQHALMNKSEIEKLKNFILVGITETHKEWPLYVLKMEM